jgi:hypothetical protein
LLDFLRPGYVSPLDPENDMACAETIAGIQRMVENPWPGRCFWLLVGGAIVYSFWMTVGKPDCQDLDFGSYFRAAVAVRSGTTPYKVDEYGPLGVYPYALAYAYLLIPLTYRDYIWACRLWMNFNWLATACSFWLALKLVFDGEELGPRRYLVLLLIVVPLGGYIWANLRVGQVAMFMVLAILGWLYCQRSGWRLVGGILLACACALKLAPLIFAPYLLVHRDRRAIAGFALGVLALFFVPACWVGLAGSGRLHEEWITHTLATHVPVQTYRPGNQSLLAQLARLPAISNGHRCFSEGNLALLHRYYPLVVIGIASAFYAWVIWRRRSESLPSGPPRTPFSDLLPFAVLFVLLTLLHPRAWRCHFVALLLPCALVVKHVLQQGRGFRFGLFALALCLVACVLPTDGQDSERWHWYNWLAQGKHFWAAFVLGLACIVLDGRGKCTLGTSFLVRGSRLTGIRSRRACEHCSSNSSLEPVRSQENAQRRSA